VVTANLSNARTCRRSSSSSGEPRANEPAHGESRELQELRELERQYTQAVEDAVARQDFEVAAELRDKKYRVRLRIRELRSRSEE
jgi:hypothetical protein